jgi:hypothetical protein
MIRDVQKAIKKLYIADPTQMEKEGTIHITNNLTKISKVYSIHFPTGTKAGSSQLLVIE